MEVYLIFPRPVCESWCEGCGTGERMGREEHLIRSGSHPFQAEQQQEGGALVMDLFRWGWGREGWREKSGVAIEGKVGESGTFNLL